MFPLSLQRADTKLLPSIQLTEFEKILYQADWTLIVIILNLLEITSRKEKVEDARKRTGSGMP